MFSFFKNEHVYRNFIDVVGILATVALAVIQFGLHSLLVSMDLLWRSAIPKLHLLMDKFSLGYADLLWIIVSITAVVKVVPYVAGLGKAVYYGSLGLYAYLYGRDVVPVYLLTRTGGTLSGGLQAQVPLESVDDSPLLETTRGDYLSMKVEDAVAASSTIKKESAFAVGQVYARYEQDPLPVGVFMIVADQPDKTQAVVGHGFIADNRIITAHHIVCHARFAGVPQLYAYVPGKKALPIDAKVETEDPFFDYVEMKGIGIAATLGIKSLKSAMPVSDKSLCVYHLEMTPNGPKYLAQFVADCKLQVVDTDGAPFPQYLTTRSNTQPTDSGLPVMQDGRVVALHTGSYDEARVNAHAILVPLLTAQYEKLLALPKQVVASSVLRIETPTDRNDIAYWAGRAREIEEARKREKEERMRGEHQDEQGYRKSRKKADDEFGGQAESSTERYLRARKGKGGKIVFEDDVPEAETTAPPASPPEVLKDKAPGLGAPTNTHPSKETVPLPLQSQNSEATGPVQASQPAETPRLSASSKSKTAKRREKLLAKLTQDLLKSLPASTTRPAEEQSKETGSSSTSIEPAQQGR